MTKLKQAEQSGFTLVELLMAMAVFSFMLLIIATGMLNIMRVRNQTLASNAAQDSARAAMSELVRAVRDSTEVVSATTGALCLMKSGSPSYYHLSAAGALLREEDCTGSPNGTVQLTNNNIRVVSFDPVIEVSGPLITKQEVKLTLTVQSANETATNGSCNDNNSDRQYCSAITITSGAVSR